MFIKKNDCVNKIINEKILITLKSTVYTYIVYICYLVPNESTYSKIKYVLWLMKFLVLKPIGVVVLFTYFSVFKNIHNI